MRSSVLLGRLVCLAAVAVLQGGALASRPAQAEPVKGLTELFRADGRWTAATCGDLDGSGDLRVLAARMSPPGAEVVVYDLQGTVVSRWPVGDGVIIWSVGLLQADEDKEIEVLTFGVGEPPSDVLTIHKGDGTLVRRRTLEHGTPPVIADVDGDGKSDILRIGFRRQNRLQLLRADLTVSWEIDAPELVPTFAVCERPEFGAGDLDGDGRAEIVVQSLDPCLVVLDASGTCCVSPLSGRILVLGDTQAS